MMASLKVLQAAPYISVQDAGRPDYLRDGVSRGGAVDQRALELGRLLVGNPPGLAALEMLKLGGRFEIQNEGVCAALTGAGFGAKLDSKTIRANSSFRFEPGQILDIGAARKGNYGYLSLSGGIDLPLVMGSRSTHVRFGFGGFEGRCLRRGDVLPLGSLGDRACNLSLPQTDRTSLKKVRILWGAQAQLFSQDELQRFTDTCHKVTHELDRMGVRLTSDAAPIHSKKALVAISGAIVLGDIQIPGDGRPIVLLADRQTTGGYPRIATIIGADIGAFSQRSAGSMIRFEAVTEQEAIEALRKMRDAAQELPGRLVENSSDPFETHKLLSQNLISGVVSSQKNPKEPSR